MTDEALLDLLREAASAVGKALEAVDDWGPSGRRLGQYSLDLVADEAALGVLSGADIGVMSEESGFHHPEREFWVALDPVDGSTNASRRIPWFATSLCLLDDAGPRVALVANLATGDRFEAVRGRGAWRNGEPISPTACASLGEAIVGVTAWPRSPLGARQVRSLGAAALDRCAVAAGSLDAYIDFSADSHGPWDYLAALLVCTEAGAHVAEAEGRPLVTREAEERRAPVAAATGALLAEALAARAPSR